MFSVKTEIEPKLYGVVLWFYPRRIHFHSGTNCSYKMNLLYLRTCLPTAAWGDLVVLLECTFAQKESIVSWGRKPKQATVAVAIQTGTDIQKELFKILSSTYSTILNACISLQRGGGSISHLSFQLVNVIPILQHICVQHKSRVFLHLQAKNVWKKMIFLCNYIVYGAYSHVHTSYFIHLPWPRGFVFQMFLIIWGKSY